MRRPLCAAAMVYVLVVFVLLQICPPAAEDLTAVSGEQVRAEGVVAAREYKTSEEGTVTLLVTLEGVTIQKTGIPETGTKLEHRLLCRLGDGTLENAEEIDDSLQIGMKLEAGGKLRSFRAATNSGEFDLEQYYRTRGYSAQLTGAEIVKRDFSGSRTGTSEVEDLREGRNQFLLPGLIRRLNQGKEALYRCKRRLSGVLDTCLPAKTAGILKAMLLGDKATLDPEIKSLYQSSGIVHILAISGMHISLLGMGLHRLLQKLMHWIEDAIHKCAGSVRVIRKQTGFSGKWNTILPAVLVIAGMWCYGWMTGMGASAFRAIVMFCLHILAGVFRRTYDLQTALAVAGILLLLQEPLYLLDAGFLFSFGAVLGIAVLMPVFRTRLMRGLAVTLATLPIYLMFYYSFPIYSLLLNLAVIPLMSVVMASGILVLLLGSLAGPVGPLLGTFAGYVPTAVLTFYEGLCLLTGRLPWGNVNLGAPAGWQVVLYLGILLLVVLSPHWEKPAIRWMNRRAAGFTNRMLYDRKRRTTRENVHRRKEECRQEEPGKSTIMADRMRQKGEALRILLMAAGVIVLCLRFHSGLSLHVIDVGQGDGMLLQAEGENILIDGGSTDKSSVGKYQVIPLLQYYGVKDLICLVTHEDADHISGVTELLEADDSGIRIKALLLPSTAESAETESYTELEQLAKQQDIPIRYLAEGDILEKGKLRMECLHPEKENTYSEPNERSVTMYLTYGDFTCLLNGDLEGGGEERLLTYVEAIRRSQGDTEGEMPGESSGNGAAKKRLSSELTLLHVAHHGSNGATSEAFLKEFAPLYAFVSCGEGNRYGHPGEEAMQRLKDAGVQEIFDIRFCGEITFHTDGKTLRVKQNNT